jgi:uncharacterized protein with PIN domain
MKNAVQIRFYEELNDFLPAARKKVWFSHLFENNPAIKDLIEALGVPHTEVDLILVNGNSVDFTYQVQNGDEISVYPVFESLDISEHCCLRPKPLREPKFILDVHLGKLAKYLRMLGFDSLYEHTYTDEEIARIIEQDPQRIVLTRDVELLKRKVIERGYWIRSTQPLAQVKEVLNRFYLFSLINPFTVCLACNGKIKTVAKEEIEERLPPKVRSYFKDFNICTNCRRIYWQGTHYEKMLELVSGLEI